MTRTILIKCLTRINVMAKMAKNKVIDGYGRSIPPQINHVIIYFLQKGKSEKDALDFFYYYSEVKWRNRTGHLIKDWKMHAWEWIWNKIH